MKPTIRLSIPPASSGVVRVGDLEIGTCFLKEHRAYVKQRNGYCLDLKTFECHQVRPLEQVEEVLEKIDITVW